MIGHSDDTELNAQPEEIAAALRAFRADVHAAAEKPEAFWENQRAIVSAQLGRSRPAPWRGPVLLWVPVLTVMLFCLFLFVENGKAPTPDFAAGADQDLLTGVERAVDQEYPDALAPAALLAQEMEPAVKGTTP
jgi:hypothetical protein